MGMSICLATIDGLRLAIKVLNTNNPTQPPLPVITPLHHAIFHICLLTGLKTPTRVGTHIFTQLPPHLQSSSFLLPSFLTPLSLASATDEVLWNRPPQTQPLLQRRVAV